MSAGETIRSRIWSEEPAPDNPFQARVCRCAGYDVYGEVIRKAGWSEYLYLLFRGERPAPDQARALERLALALANPGPRDLSVRAAMNAGVGGSTSASALMAALAVGAGVSGGAHEVFLAAEVFARHGADPDAWAAALAHPPAHWHGDFWPAVEHPPGFEPYADHCALPVRQTLDAVVEVMPGGLAQDLRDGREALERAAGAPLAMTGAAAAVLVDLGFPPEQAEMLFLLLRLPGAAVHALEQRGYGWRKYPFFRDGLVLTDDPGPVPAPAREAAAEPVP